MGDAPGNQAFVILTFANLAVDRALRLFDPLDWYFPD